MKLEIEFKDVDKLSKREINFMNHCRIKEYGKGANIDFKTEDKNAKFIFVKDDSKIKAFGMLKPVKVHFQGKIYNILGIGRGLAVEKGEEYGRLLNVARIYYLKKTGKTGVGFTSKKNKIFFEKAGLKFFKNLISKFRYKNPITGEMVVDNDGEGIYYEGEDKLISKMQKSKSFAYVDVDFW